MRRIFLLIALASFFNPNTQAQTLSIAEARSLPEGSMVTVRGMVTNGPELGKIRYLQDGSAGIAAFPGNGSQLGFEQNVQAGDSVLITGPTVYFQGLLEISPVLSYTVISSGNALPEPRSIALGALSDALESQLVQLECASFEAAGALFNAGGTYAVYDDMGGQIPLYLRSGHPLQGAAVPTVPVRLVGILSKYVDYQLVPRSIADLAPTACFYFVEKPRQTDITQNSFALRWQTNVAGTAKLRYGPSPALGSELPLNGSAAALSATLDNLEPGRIYWAQVECDHNGDLLRSETRPFATQSASSGQIKVFFNHPVAALPPAVAPPAGQSYQALLAETLLRINAAQQTIDVAMYNNNRDDLVAALEAAVVRGVRVRYIAAAETANFALDPAPNFPVVYGNDQSLMHNKFMVVDAALSQQAWVMGGSTNWTGANLENDFNNALFIQDQSLARCYTLEFEEMWGGDGPLPNPANQRFGAAKKDNTPHDFIIGTVPVQCWFSPSDRVTDRIVETLRGTDSELLFALLTFTKNEPGDEVAALHQNGVQVRGLIENVNDVGSEFDYLLGLGVDVRDHTPSGMMHHKYCVVDGNQPDAEPTVLTGSHNWTFTAETANDENTLVFRDATIAAWYRAEFEQRWSAFVSSTQNIDPDPFVCFPNPASDWIWLPAPAVGADLSVFDALGRQHPLAAIQRQGEGIRADVRALPSGHYFVHLHTAHGRRSFSFQKI
jgi:phosphatidylserine/phosphatidylglycerophosphate/cardiolipin synthase-like enzyme